MLFAVATTTRASRTTSAALEAQEGAAVRVAVASAATTVAAEEEEAEKRPCARSNLRDRPRASSSASKTNTCSDCKTVVPSTSCTLLTICTLLIVGVCVRRVCEALHVRESRNDKELTVQRGEILEVRPNSAVTSNTGAVRSKGRMLQWTAPAHNTVPQSHFHHLQ